MRACETPARGLCGCESWGTESVEVLVVKSLTAMNGVKRDWWPTGFYADQDRVFDQCVLPGTCACGLPVWLIGSPSSGEPFMWAQPGTTRACAHS